MKSRLINLVFVLPLLVACSGLQTLRGGVIEDNGKPRAEQVQQVQQVPVVDGNNGVHSWLADLQGLRSRPTESLAAVLDAREQAFRAVPDAENRMRLVMLLLHHDEAVRDPRRARLLLRRLEPLPAAPGEREFIRLLKSFLDEELESQQKLVVLWKQVTQQNQRIDELEQQLQALTNIEQNIQQRETPPVKSNGKQ